MLTCASITTCIRSIGPNLANMSRIFCCVVYTLNPNTPIQRFCTGFSCEIVSYQYYKYIGFANSILLTLLPRRFSCVLREREREIRRPWRGESDLLTCERGKNSNIECWEYHTKCKYIFSKNYSLWELCRS